MVTNEHRIEACQALDKFDSYDGLSDLLNDDWRLYPNQAKAVARLLIMKKVAVTFDTGEGKTVVAGGMINFLKGIRPGKKVLFIGLTGQKVELPKKLDEESGLKCRFYSSAAKDRKDLFTYSLDSNLDVIALNQKALQNNEILMFLLRNKNKFSGIILDEAHNYTNIKGSKTGQMCAGLTKNFEYVLALTATPSKSSLESFTNLMRIINYKEFWDHNKVLNALSNKGTNLLLDYSIINGKRIGGNRKPQFILVVPMEYQLENKDKLLPHLLFKGRGAIAQQKATLMKVREFYLQGKRPYIFSTHTEVQYAFMEVAEHFKYKGMLINGDMSKEEQYRRIREFEVDKSYHFIMGNIKESIKIEAEYIIMYEISSDVTQVVGRIERGKDSKDIDIFYVITTGTTEVDSYYKNVYRKAEATKTVLDKDYKEIQKISDDNSILMQL